MWQIKNIEYDEFSKEADIEFVEESGKRVLAYCPYYLKKSESYKLISFLPYEVEKSEKKEDFIKINQGFYSYMIFGKVIEVNDGICSVSVKGLKLELDEYPNDVEINNYIKFKVKRIDYIEQ